MLMRMQAVASFWDVSNNESVINLLLRLPFKRCISTQQKNFLPGVVHILGDRGRRRQTYTASLRAIKREVN